MENALTIAAVYVVVMILLLSSNIKVVREHKRLEVYRLGRSIGQKGPGLVYLIPIVDRAVLVDVPDDTTTTPLFKRVSVEEFSKKFPEAWNRRDISGQIVAVTIKKERV